MVLTPAGSAFQGCFRYRLVRPAAGSGTMPKKRKLTGNDYKIEEQFTDRKDETSLFKSKMSDTSSDYNILMFYGVGGIGKSRLRKEISRIHAGYYSDSSIQFELNLEPPENRNAGDGILNLVDSCRAKSKT